MVKSISGNNSGVVSVNGSNEGSGVVSSSPPNRNGGTVDSYGSGVDLKSGIVSKPVVNNGISVVNGIVKRS